MKTLFFLPAFIIINMAFVTQTHSDDKPVVGWIENIKIYPGNLLIRAKLDTGAKNSSLHATQINIFERNGETWVNFYVIDRQRKKFKFEKKVHRYVKIKERGTASAQRPVILLGICLDRIYKEVEVNLEDRRNFNYQMLIGRSFLKGSVLIDASATFTTKPNCEGIPGN